jgi:hypothetical protein
MVSSVRAAILVVGFALRLVLDLAPVSRSVQRAGVISSSAILGGLHHPYRRI